MSEEIILPEGYTRVSYLASTGTQYIDLPVNTVEGDVVELVAVQRFLEISNQAEAKNGNPYFFFGISGGNWYAGCGIGSAGMFKTQPADVYWHSFRLKYTPNSSDGGFWIDDEKYHNCEGTANVLPTYISLFKTYGGDYWTKTYKKSWKLYVNDVLRYDLIPCLDNVGVPCMYDLVGGETYYNQGTGTFCYIISPYPNNEDYESELPIGYTKCLYLQSDGTQYISTSIYKDISGNDATSTEAGIIPTDETGLYIKAQRLNYGNCIPFGVNDNGNGYDDGNGYIYPPRFDMTDKHLRYGWNRYIVSGITYDKGDDLIYSSSINLYNDRTVHFNSGDTDWDGYVTETLLEINYPLWLFSFNRNGQIWENVSKWGGRIYRAKITQGTELIRDFVPCLDASGVPCMYDLVNGGSYYNQGSGSDFEYCIDHKLPSDFIKLKYLEATGTQYINTNYIPQATDNGDGTYTATTGLYIDTYNITAADSLPMGCRNNTDDTRFFTHRLMSPSHGTGYGWGMWNHLSTNEGKVAYQSKLNFLNDKKAVLEAPIFSTITNTLGNLSFQPILPIYMFGINLNNALSYPWNGRIYRAKISEGTEVVRDYVPAFDQRLARPCMYDIINNVAYYNDGTGEFLYDRQFEGDYVGFTQIGGVGNRVGGIYEDVPSDYIKVYFLGSSTRDQHINPVISVTSDTGAMCEIALTNDLKWQHILSTHNSGGHGGDEFWVPHINADTTIFSYVRGNARSSVNGQLPRPALGERCKVSLNYMNNNKATSLDGVVDLSGSDTSKITGNLLLMRYTESSTESAFDGRIFSCKITEKLELIADLIPSIDASGNPCFWDKVRKRSFYNAGRGSFIVGLTKYQARELYKLPPTTNGTLTISIPASIVDTDGITITDARVKSAKEKAEEKGWKFTIQTYTE